MNAVPAGLPPLDEIEYALSEKSLEDFTEIGWRYIDPAEFKPNWHIGSIAAHLEAVALGDIRDLIIMMPPRHMKSLSVNVAFRPWVWAQKKRSPLTGPSVQFLSTSYAQHLSVRDNVKARRLIDSPWYQRGWGDRFRLTSDQNTKIRFENDQGGAMLASSVDGTATGDGGDIIIIDDAISAGDALSPTIRASTNEWFDGTMSSRLNDPKTGVYVIVMQRLHEDDLVGHVLRKEEAEERGYTVLCLPARYEADHPFVFAPRSPELIAKYGEGMAGDPRAKQGDGTLLWPDRMGEKEIRKLEVGMGSYGAAGQLQQRPAPREGGMFKRTWFNVIPAAPLDLDEVRAWDLAGTVPKPGTDPDWTSGTKMGRSRSTGRFVVVDQRRERESPHKVERMILNTAGQDGKHVRIRLPQDPGQAGKSQAQTLIRMLAGYAAYAVPPTGSKETRATAFAAQCEAGNVDIVAGDWNNAFFDELETFPFGTHDDQVDSASDAFNELAGADKSAGFFSMVVEDNAHDAAERERKATEEAAVVADPTACPHPKGSLEWLQWHGLMPS